jgi:hypothetical protein
MSSSFRNNLADHFAHAGHQVALGARDPQSSSAIAEPTFPIPTNAMFIDLHRWFYFPLLSQGGSNGMQNR